MDKYVNSVVGDGEVVLRSHLSAIMSSKHKDMNPSDMKDIVDTLINTMSKSLICGEGIEIRGFGSFVTRLMKAHQGRNPKTGEPHYVEERRKIHFKPGKGFKQLVNNM